MGSVSATPSTPTPPKPAVFSTRGQDAVNAGRTRKTWDIISDMWHAQTNPDGILSIGMAENSLMHETMLEYINANSRLSSEHLTYNNGSMGSRALRAAVAHFLNRHFHPRRRVEPAHVLMTNGCSSAIEHLSFAFCNPGEAVLLSRPYYSTFVADLTLRPEAVVVPVDMDGLDPLSPEVVVARYEKAAQAYEDRTGKAVRAVMLCNPHNPLGRCYPRATVDALLQLCQKRQMHLISDEIYALSVWKNTVDGGEENQAPFESLLSRDLTGLIDPHLVHVMWGMSKDFGANGLRVGAIISQSNEDFHVAQRCMSLYSFVSSMSDQITARILTDDAFTDAYIAANQAKLSASHAYLAGELNKHGIDYARGCHAGFFLWVNLGKKYRELHPEDKTEGPAFADMIFQKLMDQKVYVAHGTAYGSEIPGWYRLVFSHPLPWLEEAMARVLRAIN